ncbi:DUF3862 domain-containing protein [Aliiglaciecola sp. LCG003]|uniref:DUF3862 domain-containing protein n=1 Tax=Aliiglaciecola sp. LCG003 TaxID=3053655 RepID=UPI002572DB11|nr:DUF3862 domain-containing protein [Aliiglaciecola sp. LCG003]WJG07664.1 DUF3862 domain-containing protein [Aliiglaciecola sp. LCG003]
MLKITLKCIAIVGLLMTVQACSKLTKSNYDKIEMGMIRSDVEMVLGKPEQCEQVVGTFSCVWGDQDGTYIKINFIADRAAVFKHKGLK